MTGYNFFEREQCPACGERSIHKIYSLPEGSLVLSNYLKDFYFDQGGVDVSLLKGWSYELYQCKTCTLTFQKNILGDELMRVLYEEWINPEITLEWSKKHPLSYYLNLVEEITLMVSYFGKQPYELKFLDFGMGWAEWCKVASALGCQAYGAELSARRRDHAAKHNIEVIDIDSASPNTFDCINTEQVFEHIPHPLRSLKKLKELLKPGGLIKISVPDGYQLAKLLLINNWQAPKGTADSLNVVAPLEHINCFNHKSLLTMAKRSGLSLVTSLAYRKYPRSVMDVLKNSFRHWYINKVRPNKGTYLFFQKPF